MRVASFNISHGRGLGDGLVDLSRFAAAIADLDADILALQEVDREQPRSGHADLTSLAGRAMGAAHARFVATLSGTPGRNWSAASGNRDPSGAAYGIALLSRYPVRCWRVLPLPSARVWTPVWVPGMPRPVIMREEPRVAMCAVIDTPLGSVTVVNTHLSFLPGVNVVQLYRLRRELATESGAVLLAGDLNLSGDHPSRITGYRSLGHVPTYPAPGPRRQLDHLLANAHLPQQARCAARELPVSDHRAIVAEFTAATG